MGFPDLWLVVGVEGPDAVTDSALKAEQRLIDLYCDEYNMVEPEQRAKLEARLGIDLKLGDWCLTLDRVRDRRFYYRRIERL